MKAPAHMPAPFRPRECCCGARLEGGRCPADRSAREPDSELGDLRRLLWLLVTIGAAVVWGIGWAWMGWPA